MCSPERSARGIAVLLVLLAALTAWPSAQTAPPASSADRSRVLETMKRATTFMVDTVSVQGGYVWSYLPDLSRRWGEMEARPTMIWIQPPGTATMGHLFLDAYHATSDDYYYRAAEKRGRRADPGAASGRRLELRGRLPPASASLRAWYDTVGKHGWRLEEFQHYWGNATFDDAGTAEAARLLLRLYVEKRDPKYRPALDKAIQFVLDSQYPIGAWPQRYPLRHEFATPGKPDYTSFPTFNDDVAAREHRVPAAVLPGPGRRPGPRRGAPRHGRLPGHAAGPAAGRLGPAVHAGPEADRRAHLRADGAGHPHHRRQRRAAAALLPADRRPQVPGADSRRPRLARLGEAVARGGDDRRRRPHPSRPSSRSAPTRRSTCTAPAPTW